jgi:hypothetical protein
MTAPRASGVLSVGLRGIGLQGPGFADWATGRAALNDPAQWLAAPTVLVPPGRLPPAERRRAGAIVKLCIAVADQACAQAGVDTLELATVFTASAGDGANCSALCEVLATPERLVSPTRFTNSVHNAAAGYWHIATTSRAPSTSLCAHDASFGAGLLEAASQCLAWQRPVLLVAGDTPYPEPLNGARPLPDAFACALLLVPPGWDAPHGGGELAQLRLQLDAGPPTACSTEALETLRQAIPAARGLSLLQALAGGGAARCTVEYQDGLALQVDITPGAPA